MDTRIVSAYANGQRTHACARTRRVLESHPRSRTEAYPLYVLTKDVLKRVVDGKCKIINTNLGKLHQAHTI